MADSGTYRAVQRTSELRRVFSVPRRTWDGETIAAELTAVLKTARGTQALRPIQGQALYELGVTGGLFAPIRVGGGKTLVSLLASAVTCAKRPLLLVPAKLREKTKIEAWVGYPERGIAPLAEHWRIPRHLRIESYEQLQQASSAAMLVHYKPDLIILDEAHKVRRTGEAARAKRVRRYVEDVGCMVLAMSGSFTNGDIRDLSEILGWCLPPESYPLPRAWSELQDWADACNEESRCGVGALADFGAHDAESARHVIRARLNETAGVVSSSEKSLGVSLVVSEVVIPPHPSIVDAFRKLRGDPKDEKNYPGWETPDGWPLQDAFAISELANQLALGFYYVWDPRPPPEWMRPRKTWNTVCRYIVRHNRRELDSELQVTQAIRGGEYDGETVEVDGEDVDVPSALRAWERVKNTFEPNVRPVWLTDAVMKQCAAWLKGGGLVWVDHVHFGEELSRVTKLPYFGAEGKDRSGRFIESAPGVAGIASIESNFEGRNLQAWNRGLIATPPASGDRWEQLLGRKHRDGQKSPEVVYEVLNGCAEHVLAFEKARTKAKKIQDLTGQEQKLCYASVMYGTEEKDWRYRK